MNILIVEDEPLYGDMLAKFVQEFGHDAARAETGQAAYNMALRTNFDLFLLDVFLPDMSAMELIPRLQGIQPDPLIITLTGQSSRELERELRELGIAYYMAKPVPVSELRSILEHMSRDQSRPFSGRA